MKAIIDIPNSKITAFLTILGLRDDVVEDITQAIPEEMEISKEMLDNEEKGAYEIISMSYAAIAAQQVGRKLGLLEED